MSCGSGAHPRFDTTDLNGDGVLDFIVTSECAPTTLTGRDVWWVHPDCAP